MCEGGSACLVFDCEKVSGGTLRCDWHVKADRAREEARAHRLKRQIMYLIRWPRSIFDFHSVQNGDLMGLRHFASTWMLGCICLHVRAYTRAAAESLRSFLVQFAFCTYDNFVFALGGDLRSLACVPCLVIEPEGLFLNHDAIDNPKGTKPAPFRERSLKKTVRPKMAE